MGKASYHHGDLREAILDAAEEMLAESSLDAISVRELARRAGVSSGAPYHHFGDRSGLNNGLCRRGFARLGCSLSRGRKRNGLAGMVDEYLKFSRLNQSLYHLMFSAEATEGESKAKLEPYAGPVFEMLEAAIDEGIGASRRQAGDLEAVSVWCFMHGVANLSMASPLQARLGARKASEFAYESIKRLIGKS